MARIDSGNSDNMDRGDAADRLDAISKQIFLLSNINDFNSKAADGLSLLLLDISHELEAISDLLHKDNLQLRQG